ncbi:hypothetical protein C8R44DRAFT_876721 [Mycena epipterygia]|nr:hypothetical protein C8R44DRAFT_876721 [Mycena epipterygia]
MHLSTLILAFFISLTGVSGQSIPVVPAGYTFQYTNLTCASDDMNECADKCDIVSKYVNVDDGKVQISLFSFGSIFIHLDFLNAASATNCGDQQQQDPPNGRTYITNRYEFSKDTPTA